MLDKTLDKIKFYIRRKKIYSPERIFFENIFISSLIKSNINNVLFVGIGPYTYHYSKLFKKVNIDFYSLDYRNESMLWAFDKSKHKILDVKKVTSKDYGFKFDLIIVMGMIGYGINNEKDLFDSTKSLKKILNDKGILMIAYESKFGIKVEEVLGGIKDIELNDFLEFNKKTIIQDDLYRFYFYKKY